MIVKPLEDIRSNAYSSYIMIEKGTDCEVLREEGNDYIVRGSGFVCSCNGTKPRRSQPITMKVPKRLF